MLHYRLITAPPDWSTLTCVKLAFSRTSGAIYVVMCGKRFSTHVGEGNVARIGEGRCGNDKGIESAAGE